MSTEIKDEREDKPSASGMDRLYHCPGSWAAEKDMSPLKEQDVTASGSAIHAALESGDDEPLELTDREIKERMSSIEKQAVSAWREEFNLDQPTTPRREERLWIRHRATLEPAASAQLDVYYVSGTHALAIDFKSGYSATTSSDRNWQCRVQALCLWHEFPQLTHIRGAILASRLYDKFDATDYDTASLQTVERELFHILWRAEQSDAPRVPGPHCRYCRFSPNCKELSVYSMIGSANLPVKADGLQVAQVVAAMTPAEMAFVRKRKSLANAVFEAVDERLKAMPTEELAAVGLKLVDGVTVIKFINMGAAMSRLLNIMTPDERNECVKVSIPAAAKIFADTNGVTLKKARETVEVTLGDSFQTSTGNPRLKEI